MLVPLVAITRVSTLWPHVIVAALGIGLGHWYSYRNLEKGSQVLRGLMFVAIHLALCWLFVGLVVGAAVPQAQFAIFAQAITSFDLRYRSSLFNTLLHSLANLYVAASLSRTVELALYLILFAVLVLAAFFTAEKEDGLRSARLQPKPTETRSASKLFPVSRRSMTVFGFGFGVLVIPVILVAFIVTPRFANNPLVPPFTLNIPLQGGITSEIINPGVPLVQVNGWNDGTSDYFYGFDTNLDLRYRGGLSNDIVMYVRSPSRSYWRSHSYDFYTGTGWTQSDKTLTDLKRRHRVQFKLPLPPGSPLPGASGSEKAAPSPTSQAQQRIVQSFTLVRDQPNLIFAAYRPAEIFITAERISLDSGDGLRLPKPLKAGMTYSVISDRPEFDPDLLRQTSTEYPPEITSRYLQLPDNISGRVRNLASTLTAPYDNPYDKVMVLNDHLLTEYPYNFFPPPHPSGAEVVDTFLFEDQEGVCEQYVTALVVMARLLGIPARLATGYGWGDYNPITNYYEVRLNDAHSWAEVYFPEYGWVPFDPTPGWTPQPYPTPVQNWLFANNGQFLNLDLPTVPVAAIVAGGAAGLAFLAPLFIVPPLLVGLGMLAIFLGRRFKQLLASRAADRYTSLARHPHRRLILQIYQRAAKLLISRKYDRRDKGETLTEYTQRVGNLPALARLTQAAEIAVYRPEAPGAETVAEAEAALGALKKEL